MRNFSNKVVYIICSYVAYALLYAIYRVTFLLVYANPDVWSNKQDIFRAFLTGFRFDAKVITICLLPLFLIAIAHSLLVKYGHWGGRWRKGYTITNTVLFVATAVALAVDFYYYSFYQSHIDVLVFGLIDDDTKEVLVSVWKDFPVVRVVIALALLGFGAYKLFDRLLRFEPFSKVKLGITGFAPGLLLFLTVYFYGMWGTFSTFPLQIDDSTISKNSFINQLTLNGAYTFEQAYKQHKRNQVAGNPSAYLQTMSLRQLVADFLQLDVAEVDEQQPLRHLYVTTPSNPFLKENPPHVVVLQMESMGTIYFAKHTKQLNLLGALEDALKHCYLLKNFMPATNGTISTLEALTTQTPIASVAQSPFYAQYFSTATTRPFLQSGYQTSFVTAGKLGWRNINSYLSAQGFQSVEGRELILADDPHAQESGWGVFDEFMFDRIFKKIEKSSAPQYIYGMSVTNHTPYEIPKNYNLLPVTVDDSLAGIIRSTVDINDVAVKNFQSYQYACDALGKFIEKIRKSPFSENTIIVATGDHNCRQLFNFDDNQMYWTYSVPLVAYIPPKYLAKETFNTQQWAWHSDIFPTLYEMALSEASYIKLGRDLVNDKTIPYAVNADDRVFSESGAFSMSSSLYFGWGASSYLFSAPGLADNPELQKVYRSAKAAHHLKVYLQYENTSRQE
ncbi:MAG: sulfatase-like hydrolase/transferase [Prevotellaceae bacterium]|jgi:phosphoglycerol transferase MdoB-like AlkP superfamily enzyme|nr:sulfatase-like hydrolase/transferase [Prevotellaceae bacterium]